MVTLATSLENLRSNIDETVTNNRFWSDKELRVWINDAVRDIARTAEVILIFNGTLAAIPNVARYALPSDIIRLHRCEYVPPAQNQTYPIELRTYDELDQMWGIQQAIASSYPSFGVVWGTPGSMRMQFYPVPAQGGRFNLYYYGMPANLNTDGTQDSLDLKIPAGWDDMVILGAEYRAKRKAKDQSWQEAKALFEEQMQHLVDVTREAHDNGRFMQTSTSSGVPGWLTSFGDDS